MDTINDYFTMRESKVGESASWGHNWSHSVSTWETTTPLEMPIWQYTAAALGSGTQGMQYCPNGSPVSPYPQPSTPSTVHTPNVGGFPNEVRVTPLSPIYDGRVPPPNPIIQTTQADDDEDDEESDRYSWSPNTPPAPSTLSSPMLKRPPHRRTKSANETSLRNAKRAHTVVERNYRERLNDKIADLGLYLFESSSDSRTRPSKSLVMTRAKERLQQLEARNKTLEGEVVKLRQHIAILDHIVASRGGSGPGSGPVNPK